MDQSPLVTEQIEAGTKFLSEFEKSFPVIAALWLKASDVEYWNLYVSSDRLGDENFRAAYGEVVRVAKEMGDPNLDPFQVKLIKATDPIATAAIEITRRFPGRIPARFRQRNFGGVGVDEVYIYPTPIAVA